jgi:hypothetical protein
MNQVVTLRRTVGPPSRPAYWTARADFAAPRRSIASSILITTGPVGSKGIQSQRNRKCNWPTPRKDELGHCHGVPSVAAAGALGLAAWLAWR